MDFKDVVQKRRSVKNYDPAHRLTDAELKVLFASVEVSPSSFNLQYWRFVVVRDKATQAELCKAAWGQEMVRTASAAIVVLGNLFAHEDANRIYEETPPSVRETLLPLIAGAYTDNPAARRDETIRSTSLAAMALMLAAVDMGYAACPLIGFDPKKVCEIIGSDARHLPVMMVVIGKEVGETRPRAMRLPMDETVRLERFDGEGLK